jgi:hypothetical protein
MAVTHTQTLQAGAAARALDKHLGTQPPLNHARQLIHERRQPLPTRNSILTCPDEASNQDVPHGERLP